MSSLLQLRVKLRQTDATTFYVLAALLTLIVMSWGFIELADDMMEGDTHQVDTWILTLLRQEHNLAAPIGPPWLLIAARDITALGGHTVLTLFTMLASLYCVIIRRFGSMLLIIAASAGGTVLSSLLKWGFSRTRPDIVPHLVEVSTLSFPSGHAMLSAAIYLSLGSILAQATQGHRRRIFILGTALTLTGLIGLSRIYLGVHYPSDVLAGWAAGLAWAMFCWLTALYLERRKGKPI